MGIAMRKVQGIAKQSQERVSDSSVPHSRKLGYKSLGMFPLALEQRRHGLGTQTGTVQHSIHIQADTYA